MKILFDHQIFSFQKYGGISRYFIEIIKNLVNCQTVLPRMLTDNHYLKSHFNKQELAPFMSKINFKGKSRIYNIINKRITINKIKKGDFDVFHPTYYDPYFLNYLKNKPFMLTVHDLIHERLPKEFQENDITTKNKKLLIEKASKIIAISENTKKDLIDLYGVSSSKIEVIYHGNSLKKVNNKLNYKLPKDYMLYIGSRAGYKNFNRFIEGSSRLLRENESLKVVCVGGGEFTRVEKALFKKLNIEKLVQQFNVKDAFLHHFYAKAKAFVFPSLYEGFGIPILESFASNCPLVCSNTSSLPEIARDAAIYFDPYSKESIYDAVSKVIEDQNLRSELIRKGKELEKEFSWVKTAKRTKEVYISVLKEINDKK